MPVPGIPITARRKLRVGGNIEELVVQGSLDVYRVETPLLGVRDAKGHVTPHVGWGETEAQAVESLCQTMAAAGEAGVEVECPACGTFGTPLFGECKACGGAGFVPCTEFPALYLAVLAQEERLLDEEDEARQREEEATYREEGGRDE